VESSLANLTTHLIIRISKGQAVDGKRETKEVVKIGYVRVSKEEKNEALQRDGLKK
jgi:hypothetical protein